MSFLVIGNGFDLHLKIKSSIKDFLTRKVFKKTDSGYTYDGNNLLYLLFYLRFFAKAYSYESFERVDNDDPTWMDVESFIKEIATSSNIYNHLKKAYEIETVPNHVFKNEWSREYPTSLFINIFHRRKITEHYPKTNITNVLLEDLLTFEDDFKKYLQRQLSKLPNYGKLSDEFLNVIYKRATSPNEDLFNSDTQIIDFNYTFPAILNVKCSNVHGTLDGNIVIGYDSTNDFSKDSIIQLSKDWQVIFSGDNSLDIRDAYLGKKIIFYGHSLGEQDYPYFYEIFDVMKILEGDSESELVFCYSAFGTKLEQKRFLVNYQVAISRLLNSYERFKKGDNSKNTIIAKLKSQKRIRLVRVD